MEEASSILGSTPTTAPISSSSPPGQMPASQAQRLGRATRFAHRYPAPAKRPSPTYTLHQPRLQLSSFSSARSQDGVSKIDKSIKVPYPASDALSARQTQQASGLRRTLARFSLEGRDAVITGGARGLGLVMARALVESGANVALVDVNHEEAETRAAELLRAFRESNSSEERLPTITAHHADVSSPASVSECIASILRSHSKIDNLVTSAGFTENFPAEDYPFEGMKKLWGVNVDGTYLFAASVARHLKARKAPGSMVFIGSMSGSIVNVPQPQAPYNAAKAAVRHLAASLAVEWAPAGIRVNCISPGYMLTALTKKILDEKPGLRERWTSLIPQGRIGRPEDLMGAVVFLASDASGYMTGAQIMIDGGYTLT